MPPLPTDQSSSGNLPTERDDWNKHWSDYDAVARYNPAQAFRRELVVHWLKERAPAARSHLLDIGSGQGDLIAGLTRIFPAVEIAGVEMSATGIAQSREKAPTARFFERDLQLVPSPGDSLISWADLAVCTEVLEHVDDPEKVLANAARFLAPGGQLFITVPGGPMSAFDHYIGHRRHFDVMSLTRLIDAAGLIPVRVCGVGFPFFNLYKNIVIIRGRALIKDAYGERRDQQGLLAKMAMKAFSLVLKRNLNSSSRGWQMTAHVQRPT